MISPAPMESVTATCGTAYVVEALTLTLTAVPLLTKFHEVYAVPGIYMYCVGTLG